MAYGRGAAAVRAIDEVTLDIAHGEFIAVVGPSGCGKSSLMKLISGLHPPASGTLTFERKTGDRAAQVGRHGLPELEPPALAHRGRERAVAARDRRAAGATTTRTAPLLSKKQGLLHSVGLAGFTEKHPGGALGRHAAAHLDLPRLIHEPEILLLDEPFAALDAFTREELWSALRDLQAAAR